MSAELVRALCVLGGVLAALVSLASGGCVKISTSVAVQRAVTEWRGTNPGPPENPNPESFVYRDVFAPPFGSPAVQARYFQVGYRFDLRSAGLIGRVTAATLTIERSSAAGGLSDNRLHALLELDPTAGPFADTPSRYSLGVTTDPPPPLPDWDHATIDFVRPGWEDIGATQVAAQAGPETIEIALDASALTWLVRQEAFDGFANLVVAAEVETLVAELLALDAKLTLQFEVFVPEFRPHPRQQIVKAIVRGLKNVTVCGERVYSQRAKPLAAMQLPALLVYWTTERVEEILGQRPRVVQRRLGVTIEAIADAATPFELLLEEIALQVEDALTVDTTQQGTAEDTRYRESDRREGEESGRILAAARIGYDVLYTTNEEPSGELPGFAGSDATWDIKPPEGSGESEPVDEIDVT